jgi:hypothetical protein
MKRLHRCIGGLGFVEYFVERDSTKFRVLPEEPRIPLSVYVGVAGMPGETAVYSWKVSHILNAPIFFSFQARSTRRPKRQGAS